MSTNIKNSTTQILLYIPIHAVVMVSDRACFWSNTTLDAKQAEIMTARAKKEKICTVNSS